MRLNYGKALGESDRLAGGVPVVGSAGAFAWHSTTNVTTDDSIVVGRKGTAGSVTWIGGPALVTDTAYWAEPSNDAVLLRFLYLILQYADLPSVCAQTGIPGLNRDRAYELRANLPPLDEQRRIADLIYRLEYTITSSKQASPWALYTALLAEWMKRPGEPLGRALTPANSVAKVSSTDSYRIIGVLRSGRGFIDRGDMSGSAITYDRLFEISADQLVYRKLTAWEGPISVTTPAEAGGWVSNEFPVFNIDPDRIRPALLRHVCRWPGLWHRIGNRLVGSVQRRKRLNPAELMQIEVPMPALQVQDDALSRLDATFELHNRADREIERLETLRFNVLKALLSGEHEIPESYDELMEA